MEWNGMEKLLARGGEGTVCLSACLPVCLSACIDGSRTDEARRQGRLMARRHYQQPLSGRGERDARGPEQAEAALDVNVDVGVGLGMQLLRRAVVDRQRMNRRNVVCTCCR